MSEGLPGTGIPHHPPLPATLAKQVQVWEQGCALGRGTQGWHGHSMPASVQEGRAGPAGVSTLSMDCFNRDSIQHS